MKAFISSFFSFKQAEDLVRIGRDNDGGYLISKSDIKKADVLIAFGICDDWSFGEEFLNHKKLDVYAYDGSVSEKYFLKQIIKNTLTIDNPSIFVNWVKTYFDYKRFFQNLILSIYRNLWV